MTARTTIAGERSSPYAIPAVTEPSRAGSACDRVRDDPPGVDRPTLRLAQGIVFGLVLGSSDAASTVQARDSSCPGILLAAALLLYVAGLRQSLKHQDPDARTSLRAGRQQPRIGTAFRIMTLSVIAAIRGRRSQPRRRDRELRAVRPACVRR